MTTTNIVLGGIAEPIRALAPTVSVSSSLVRTFVHSPEITCANVTLTTGNRDSSATLIHHTGMIQPALDTRRRLEKEVGLLRKFVQVSFPHHDGTASRTWCGVVVQQAAQRKGVSDNEILSDQTYIAFGLEWLLWREQIAASYLLQNGSASWFTIDRGIPFNGGHGRGGAEDETRWANRSLSATMTGTGGSSYAFAQDINNATYWTAGDILDYLVANFQPAVVGFKWDIDASVYSAVGWWIPRDLKTHGRTVREVLNEVLPAQRGLTYYWDWDQSTKTLWLKAQTFAVNAITLPSGAGSMAANTRQLTLDASTRQRSEISHVLDSSTMYDSVAAFGDLSTITTTLAVYDKTLIEDWTSTDLLSYRTGASSAAGYGLWNLAKKLAANDTARMSGPARRCWTRFRMADKYFSGLPRTWTESLRLSLQTPIASWIDWSNPSAPVLRPDAVPNGDYEQDLVFIAVPIKDKGVTVTRLVKVTELGSLSKNETAGSNGIDFSINVRTYDSGPGLIVEPSVPARVLALTEQSTGYEPTDFKGILSYDSLQATVTYETDTPVMAQWPVAPTVTNGQSAKHVINLAGRARLDYLAAGTIVGVDASGNPIRTSTDGYFRDDRQYLKDVARMAYEWYQIERQPIRFTLLYFEGRLKIADLIVAMSYGTKTSQVNTLISQITYDFENATTTIDTSAGEEIDFGALAIA